MFNTKDLLGQLMGSGMAPSSNDRMQNAVGNKGLGGLLGGLAGKAQEAFGTVRGEVANNNPLAIGGLGALAGAVLGGRGGALGGGALALLGSLAYSALNPKAETVDGERAPLGLRQPQSAAEEAELEGNAALIIRAMVNAAKADGQIDTDEVRRIVGHLEENGAEPEALEYLKGEMDKPFDMEALVRDVRSPEVAVEVYAASLLAIEIDTDAERYYLQRLANALSLQPDTIERIHTTLGIDLPR